MNETTLTAINMLLMLSGVAFAAYRVYAVPQKKANEARARAALMEERTARTNETRAELELERIRLQIAREMRADAKERAAPAPAQEPVAQARMATPPRVAKPRLAVVKPGTMLTPEVSMEPAQNTMTDEDILAAMDYKESER